MTPRHVRTVLQRHANICPVIKYGYRTKRFALAGVLAAKQAHRRAALKKAGAR